MEIEETRKETKYTRFSPTDQARRFVPFALKASGRLGRHTQAFLEDITQMRRAVFTTGAENERMAKLFGGTLYAPSQPPLCV